MKDFAILHQGAMLLLLWQASAFINPAAKPPRCQPDRKAEIDSQTFQFREDTTQEDTDKLIFSDAWLQICPPKSSEKQDVKLKTVGIPNIKAWQLMELDDLPQDTIISPPSLLEYLQIRKPLSITHEKQITALWQHIKKHGSLRHIKTTDSIVIDALRIAYVGLWGKRNIRTVEDSIKRVRGIAEVLAELEVIVEKEVLTSFIQVILAGILHDVVNEYITQNTDKTESSLIRAYLSSMFGEEPVVLAEKYNKLPTFTSKRTDYSVIQSELFLEMLITYVEDYRVLYIRLAERVQTMRQLAAEPKTTTSSSSSSSSSSISSSSNNENTVMSSDMINRKKIALEARHVYAPLAHKMNVIKFRGELEDIAFKILDPENFIKCKQTYFQADKSYTDAEEDMTNVVRNDHYLLSQQVTYEIKSRIKDKYQLHLKMLTQKLSSPNDVRDAIGFRIVLHVPRQPEEDDITYQSRCHTVCYYVVEKVRNLPRWIPAEKGFKDYIQGTKSNGYQSLHQYMRHKDLKIYVEMQVRTHEMHMNAELGEAAHWYYKDTRYRPELANSKFYKIAWRSESQMSAKSSAEFVRLAKNQILAERVLFYSDDLTTIINLEKGCTALDGAFAVHSSIGLSANHIYVNGEEVSFNYILKHGDVLTVHTTENKQPCARAQWLQSIKSAHANDTLRRYLNKSAKNMNAALGCLKLLNILTINAQIIADKFPQLYTRNKDDNDISNGIKAKDLELLIQKNTLHPHIGKFLIDLGSTTDKKSIAEEMGKLLNMTPESFTIMNLQWILTWARTQEIHGWEDKQMRNNVLMPLLTTILPENELKIVKEKWIELIGPKSLTNEESPYFTALAQKMISYKLKMKHDPKILTAPLSSSSSSPSSSGYKKSTVTSSTTVKSSSSSNNMPLPSRNGTDFYQTSSSSSSTDEFMDLENVPPAVTASKSTVSTVSQNVHTDALSSLSMSSNVYKSTTTTSTGTRENPTITVNDGKLYVNTPTMITRSPYCLEAPLLPLPLLQTAKKQYADKAMSQVYINQRSSTTWMR